MSQGVVIANYPYALSPLCICVKIASVGLYRRGATANLGVTALTWSKTQVQVRLNSCKMRRVAIEVAQLTISTLYFCPVIAGFVSTVVISASQYAFAALRSDGTVRGWGHTAIPYFGGQPLQVPSNLVTVSSPVLQIVANSYAFAALKADGSVVCFGYPTFGGSGVPTFPARVVSIFETARAFAALL